MGIYHSTKSMNKKIRDKKINVNTYSVEQATHLLECSHQIGRNRNNYTMQCILLKMKGKKAKIILFGERDWANKDHIKNIRYVNEYRLTKIYKDGAGKDESGKSLQHTTAPCCKG